jgi:hypothetical protein
MELQALGMKPSSRTSGQSRKFLLAQSMEKRVAGQKWAGEDILKPLLCLGQSRRFVSWAGRDAKGLDG